MAEKYILAIDQSTQGTKAILIDHQDQIFWKTALPHKQLINNQGWVSHDLFEIEANLKRLFEEVLVQVSGDQIESLAITNQRESAAAWSRSTGTPLCRTIVWQDNRSTELVKALTTPTMRQTLKNKTGLEISPYFTAAKWAWMLQNESTVQKANREGDLCFGTMDSWLIFQLTNGKAFKTEPSNACRTQLMNIKSGRWDDELCSTFGIKIESLPEIVDSNSHFGGTNLFGLLDHEIPILSVLGDSQAALFAHGCFDCGEFKVTFGTGSSVMLNIGENLPKSIDNKLNTSIAWSLNGKTSYVLEGNINYAGACITWLKDNLHLINSPEETSSLAADANQDDQTVLVPAFAGLGAPYWLPDMKAAFVGMTATTGKKELVRATLNSLVYQINDILSAYSDLAPKVNDEIHTDGGMIHNTYLMQQLSDITGRQVDISTISELSALGTAMNAMNHLTGTTSSSTYRPVMKRSIADSLVNDWISWIRKLS